MEDALGLPREAFSKLDPEDDAVFYDRRVWCAISTTGRLRR